MNTSIKSLIGTGTKLYLDSVHPDEVTANFAWGATGATSNPSIISEIVKSGQCDQEIQDLLARGEDDESIAWSLTDQLVTAAQKKFHPIWEKTKGNEGWVSFELDPLLEDPDLGLSDKQRTERYIQEGLRWAKGQHNRMIKVPASNAGIAALETLAGAGVTLNVTLIFSSRQYRAARDAIYRGFQSRKSKEGLKSVYSVFISRIDVYADQHLPQMSSAARGQLGILNAKRIWRENVEFWASKGFPLEQEIIFASTGTKKPEDAAWKYVAALAGSDIQTNPPETNRAIAQADLKFTKQVDQLPDAALQAEIDRMVDMDHLEQTLMSEGVAKFVKPQKALLQLIGNKRKQLQPT